mmetsp:Transcript_5460/g.13189  ORF Transcript_5460/g.13189 Transcript_5460/m.13189 type:complete len:287 (+) Transcript_5460:28-888(+)
MGSIFSFFSSSSTTCSEPKVILITGASSGIGKDAALALIRRGHVVYGAARRVDRMQDLVQAGGHAVAMDVTNEQEIVDAVKRILQEQNGKIDVLVNNAGLMIAGAAEEVSVADGRKQFDVNLFGLVRLTQEVLPHMRKRRQGTIINIGMTGNVFFAFHAWYVASKHALEGWSDCLRVELHPFNVKVSIIEPGAIRTGHADTIMPVGGNDHQRSAYTPYRETYMKNFVDSGEKYGSPPTVVSNAVIKASESQNPKRRYVVGFTLLLFLRSWFGDTVYDRITLQMMKE